MSPHGCVCSRDQPSVRLIASESFAVQVVALAIRPGNPDVGLGDPGVLRGTAGCQCSEHRGP